MDNKIKVTYIDSKGFNTNSCNPKRSWDELLKSIKSIYLNFIQSKIFPEELKFFLIEQESEDLKGIPDVASIESLVKTMDRYIIEYKIPNTTYLFIDFKRHCAIYYFSIGDTFKSTQLLKEQISLLNDNIESSKTNIDINLLCLKDCAKLNQACIMFWSEDFEEARFIFEEIITYYEATDEDMYLIKMVNFISIAFTYLAWIYIRYNLVEDAEKAFLHSIKVISTVKEHTKESLGEEEFIDTKVSKIYLYDQLINFYSMQNLFDMIEKPIHEILKIMDAVDFKYTYEITPVNKIYYYFAACIIECKRPQHINFSRIIHFLISVIKIVHENSETMEQIPFKFYLLLFKIIEAYNYNNDVNIYDRSFKDLTDDRIEEILHFSCEYFDMVLSKYDLEKIFNLNTSSHSFSDSAFSIDKLFVYILNKDFCEYNSVSKVKESNTEEYLNNELKDVLPNRKGKLKNIIDVPEFFIIKTFCDRIQYKFANIICDLVDSKNIEEKIVLESLNGFMSIDNNEIILYSTYKFVSRKDQNLYPDKKVGLNNLNENNDENREMKFAKLIVCHKRETTFAPLYFVRHTFIINKDAKSLNIPVYFSLINLLYYKKLYHPCVNLISLFLEEFAPQLDKLYSEYYEEGSIVAEGILYIVEFMLFLQIYILMMHNNFDRAIFYLVRFKKSVNEYNKTIRDLVYGICLTHYGFDEMSIYSLCLATEKMKLLILDQVKSSEELFECTFLI